MNENITVEQTNPEEPYVEEDTLDTDTESYVPTEVRPEEIIEEGDCADEPENSEAEIPCDTVESLRKELETLRAELEEQRTAFERMTAEINEFSEVFPSVPLSAVPDSVWQKVKGGVPIAAAYALYEKRTKLIEADAKKVNEKNSSSSTGPIGKEPTSDFFSPSDVRAMSRDEVRKNYAKIMESMKKWN